MPPIGLYIHIPFCVSKCPYCDFYSLANTDEALKDTYTEAVLRHLEQWQILTGATADTLYFGGGTPSLLGGERLARLIHAARRLFGLQNAEITLEANPADDLLPVLEQFAAAGGNRVSLGLQSADKSELQGLGRRHTVKQAEQAIDAIRKVGITNFSLDLMLGLESQTPETVARSVSFCCSQGAGHVSAYLLKIESGTPFASRNLTLPDEDATAVLYETACNALEAGGLHQYEISNFSVYGKESRHNLKYWNADDYLGIGPAAHSFIGGKRFYYPRDMEAFLQDLPPEEDRDDDGDFANGSPEEYAMLRLRLTEGIAETAFRQRFGYPIPAVWRERAAKLPAHLLKADALGLRLTREGFLLSNAVISRLLE